MKPDDAAQLATALQDYDAGNLGAASPVLLRLAHAYPGSSDVQAAAGMTLAETGNVAAALPYLQRAHHLAPRATGITRNLGAALLSTGDAAQALPLLQAAALQQPGNAGLMADLAQAQMRTGHPKDAANTFAAAAQLDTNTSQSVSDDLRHDWALALLTAGDPEQAASVLRSSPDLDSSAPLQSMLGEIDEDRKQYESAAQHFQRAAQLDPSEANLYNYGGELMRHWTFPAAIEVLTFAVQRYSASERLQTALGIAYYGNGTYAKAVPIFAAELQQQPDSATVADLLGRSCNALGGAQEQGCASLQQFSRAHPQNAPASLYAAVAILHRPSETQDTAGAEALLRNALRVDPKLPEAWYELAVLQQTQGHWAESADLLQHAIAERPGYPEAHYRLARAFSHMGRRDDAQKEVALQQKFASDEKAAEQQRMQEVTTFLTSAN